jgi:Fe-S oxidoreductase
MFLSEKERAETIWACRFCPMCYVADRVAGLMRKESYTPRGRGAVLFGLDRGLLQWDDTVADIMYTTLNDGRIQAWCVGGYDHEELVIGARSHLFQKGLAPESVLGFLERLRRGQEMGAEPLEVLARRGVKTDPDASVLLFCGCTVRQSREQTLVAMGRLFNAAGVGFNVLENEPCCGWPMYQLGDLGGAQDLSVRVATAIRESGATAVAVLDGDCFRMLLTRNARFGGDLQGIKIVHVATLLAEWMKGGKLAVLHRISDLVTYQDPCALARYCEDVDSPREVLSAILEGNLREMATSHRLAQCCGAGGMLGIHRPEMADAVARLRLADARETGAAILATACPRCDATFAHAMAGSEGDGLEVHNLVDLVARATGVQG